MCAEYWCLRISLMLTNFYQELCQTLFRQRSLSAAAEPLIRKLVPWYRAGLFAARILQITEEAGCLRLRLKVQSGFPLYRPGQHLQLSVRIDGREMERTFSICSPVQSLQQMRELELTIQLQPNGRFTQALPKVLRIGDYVHLSRPEGDFCLQLDRSTCLIAAGTGITPLFSMLSSVSRLALPMVLVYSFRGAARQLFAHELAALQARFPLLTLVLWDSSQQGRLTFEQLRQQVQFDSDSRFYLCGPNGFTAQFSAALQASGVSASQIQTESFGGYAAEGSLHQPVFLQLGQQQHQLNGPGSILLQAENAGVTLPYGCRRGVCMQCLCEKRSGVVRNLLTGELSDAGRGLIQLCISEAVTPVEIARTELSA